VICGVVEEGTREGEVAGLIPVDRVPRDFLREKCRVRVDLLKYLVGF
jgi:hypothetical protein